MKDLEKIKNLLKSNQKENNLIAFQLLQSQLQYSHESAISWILEQKIKQLQTVENSFFYFRDIELTINISREMDQSLVSYDDEVMIYLDLKKREKTKSLHLFRLTSLDQNDDLEDIHIEYYQQKLKNYYPKILDYILNF